MALTLCPHPDSLAPAVQGLLVEARLVQPDRLALRYRLTGAIAQMALPPPAPSLRTDLLWQHSCFEAFVRGTGSAAYCEYNFSPSTAWAAYGFTDYRAGMQPLDLSPPQIAVQFSTETFTLEAQVDLPKTLLSPLKLALSAVVEARDGTRSYWALNHAPGKPDFHHPEAFVLELGSP